ncbi:Uncharacterised protein [Mycobacteroides abscessus subsp. abscessus]|jgi:hypothetical protein|nr:Uncharacterised protein [Mycobacteroides abscessus subsp. abscessus]
MNVGKPVLPFITTVRTYNHHDRRHHNWGGVPYRHHQSVTAMAWRPSELDWPFVRRAATNFAGPNAAGKVPEESTHSVEETPFRGLTSHGYRSTGG